MQGSEGTLVQIFTYGTSFQGQILEKENQMLQKSFTSGRERRNLEHSKGKVLRLIKQGTDFAMVSTENREDRFGPAKYQKKRLNLTRAV